MYRITYLFLLCISFINSKNIRSFQKLRSLDDETEITVNFKGAKNLVFNANNKWEFDLECTSTPSLSVAQNEEFKLTILYTKPSASETKVLAICNHNQNLNFKCTYEETGQSNLDLVKISKDKIEGSTIDLSLTEDKQIPQNIKLVNKKAFNLATISDTNPYKISFDIIIDENKLPKNAFVQVDVIDTQQKTGLVDCTNEDKILKCLFTYTSISAPIKLAETKNKGSVEWDITTTSNPYPFDILKNAVETESNSGKSGTMLQKGNNGKWGFVLKAAFPGEFISYYFTVNIIIKKNTVNENSIKTIAYCKRTTDYPCQIEGDIAEDDLVYISKDTEGCTTTFNKQMVEDIQIYKVVSLNLVKAYDLSYKGNEIQQYTFIIEINDNLRNGLKVTVDLISRSSPSNNYQILGICENNNKILSCITSDNWKLASTDLILINFKQNSGTINWNGKTGEMKIPLLEHELQFISTEEKSFANNKWNFTIISKNKKFIPLYSQIIIDIKHNNADSIAICENNVTNIQSNVKLMCESEYENQANSDAIIQIIKEKKNGKAEWVEGLSDNYVIKLDNEIKVIKFKKAYNLEINDNNKWVFKIDTSENELTNNEEAQINVQVNNRDKIATCVRKDLLFTCTIDSTAKESDIIKLINNDLPISKKIWINIPESIDLYVQLKINLQNVYGAFYENKWEFKIRYEKAVTSDKSYKDNYALLDISANSVDKTAKCKILETYLDCEFNEIEANKIQIMGNTSPKLGTISFSQQTNKLVEPLDIEIKYSETIITQKGEKSKFTITGTLKETIDYDIIANTITKIDVSLNDNVEEAICRTSEIRKLENNPVSLYCEVNANINNINSFKIKVNSDGESNYVTFDSDKDIIIDLSKVVAPTKGDNVDKSGSNLININYLFTFILLFL